jgi:hypothetical protein
MRRTERTDRTAVIAILAVLAVPATVAACSDILGFKELTLASGGDATTDSPVQTVEAGVDAGTVEAGRDAGVDAPSVCTPGDYRIPARPLVDDGTPSVPQFILALESADFGAGSDAGGAAPPPGLDLDCVDTCPAPSSCAPPGSTTPCDSLGGRDIAANQLLTFLGMYETSFQPQALNSDIERGEFGLVLRIGEYNGGANDTQVDVEFFPSSGTVRDALGHPATPRYDGKDVWTTTSAALAGGTAGNTQLPSLFIDRFAYVSNHVLVTNLANTPVPANSDSSAPPPFPLLVLPNVGNDNPIVFHIHYLLGSATLVADDAGVWHAQNGNLGGRWPTVDILRGIAPLTDSIFGGNVCGTDTTFNALAGYLCPAADIATNPANDNLVAAAACDALSFGVAFKGGPAKLATTPYDPPLVPPDCPDAWAPACCGPNLCP